MENGVRSETLEDAAAFVTRWEAIRSLRAELSAEGDVLLDPLHFLAATDDVRRSCTVAVWRGERLTGLVYATQHSAKGMATGYAIGGDFSGRGLLLCSAAEESFVLAEAMRCIAANGIHSLHLRYLPRSVETIQVRGLRLKLLKAVIPGDLLQLNPDYEAFLSSLGKHTRRNIRACIRKTEDAGIVFVPSLSESDYEDAVEKLNAETDFPADPLRLARDKRLMLLHNGERMGLRTSDGKMISVMCGFRKEGRFYLLTQLNDAKYAKSSLSLVLRAYLTRFLIEKGILSLHFMGGSSLSFGRYCQPENYTSIFVDRKSGLAAAMKISVSGIVRLMEKRGKDVPKWLALLCSGYLDDASLAERTVLRPAAMLSSQRHDLLPGSEHHTEGTP